MKKLIVAGVLLFVLFYFGGQSFAKNICFGTKGDGDIVEEYRSMESFTSISVSSGITVKLIESDEPGATVTFDSNLMDKILTESDENGKLIVKYDNNVCGTSDAQVDVFYIKLNGVSVSSGAQVSSKDTLHTEDLAISASSGAYVQLSTVSDSLSLDVSSGAEILQGGSAQYADLSASSGGLIEAPTFVSENAAGSASSGGEISVSVTKSIDFSASSGGLVEYHTDSATVAKSESSGGEVVPF